MLTVLLSLHIYVTDLVVKPDKKWLYTTIIDRIELINNQVECYVMDLITKNYRRLEDLNNFHASVVVDFKIHQPGVVAWLSKTKMI